MEALKKLRKQKGWTLDYVAKELGISKSFYSQIENGKRTLTYKMAYNISKLFKLKPDKIFYNYFDQN